MNRWLWSWVGVLGMGLATGCGGTQQVASEQAPPTVVLAQAEKRDVQMTVEFSGKTVPFQTVNIVSRVNGYVEGIHYVQGDIVQPGQLLFSIQDFDYQVAQAKAYADFKTAVTQQDTAKALYESAQASNRQTPNTVPEDEMIEKRASYESARAKAYAAQAEYQYQTQQLYYTKIKSPIRGKIQKNLVDVGNYLQGTGDKVLTTVVEMHPMYVEFDVPEAAFAAQYRTMLNKTGGLDIESKSKPAVEEEETSNSLKAPEIPAAASENKTQAQPAFTGAFSQFIRVAEPKTEPKAETKTEPKSKADASPTIPAPENDINVQTPESTGVGIAGERTEDTRTEVLPFELSFMGDTKSPTYKGVVIYADNVVNPTTGTLMVRGEFANPQYAVYPGRICTVRLPGTLYQGVTVVEERAIGSDLNAKYLWVVSDQGIAEKRYVQLGELLPNGKERILKTYTEESVTNIDGSKGIVKTGLQPGEKYVIEGTQKVRAGAPVTPKTEQTSAPAPASDPASDPALAPASDPALGTAPSAKK